MRPTDKTRNQDLARCQGDHSTLYVPLELSRSSWLVTSLSPNSDKMSKHSIAAGDAPKLLALRHLLRMLERAAIGKVSGDAGRAECVIADRRARFAGGDRAPSDHAPRVRLSHRLPG
jgi:hypothetical protein